MIKYIAIIMALILGVTMMPLQAEAQGDIFAHYRSYSGSPDVVDTLDLLKAADDWIADVVPPGFSESITTLQLLALADEWLMPVPSPSPTPTERDEIIYFLYDPYVNAVLCEEWDIFDDWDYAWCLYDGGREYVPYADWEKLWYIKQALYTRAVANYDAIIAITPPEPLADFWESISVAVGSLREGLSGALPGPIGNYALENSAPSKHLEAWFELDWTCWLYGIVMPLPLPSLQCLPYYE